MSSKNTVCRRCGTLLENRRAWYCDVCRGLRKRHRDREREKVRNRATPKERGYGVEHRKLRARWAREVELGGVACARCGRLIVPGEPWDLGHDDLDRSRYQGPEHRACNRATSAHRAGRVVDARFSRRW